MKISQILWGRPGIGNLSSTGNGRAVCCLLGVEPDRCHRDCENSRALAYIHSLSSNRSTSGKAASVSLVLCGEWHGPCAQKLGKVRNEERLSVRDRGGEDIMRREFQGKTGTELLLEKCIAIFTTPENLNHCSKEEYQVAERKFLKKLDPDVGEPCVKHPQYAGEKPPPYKCARCEGIYRAVQTLAQPVTGRDKEKSCPSTWQH